MACFGLRSASPITRRAPTESRNCSGLALWNTSSGAWKNKGPGHRKKKVLSSWDARAPQMAGSSLAVGLESASSPKPSTRSGQRARSGVGPYVGIFTRREGGREGGRKGGRRGNGAGKRKDGENSRGTRRPPLRGRRGSREGCASSRRRPGLLVGARVGRRLYYGRRQATSATPVRTKTSPGLVTKDSFEASGEAMWSVSAPLTLTVRVTFLTRESDLGITLRRRAAGDF